jgi:phage-related protein
MIGQMTPQAGGEVLFGPIIIYSLMQGTLKLISDAIGSFDAAQIERVQQVASGKQKADIKGPDVFAFLKNAVLRKPA